MNLTGNAVKFTLEGSARLEIRLLDAQDGAYRLRFSVTDTGIGIPPEHQERLFEPFYRVETGDRRQFRGTGLGTTIAREHVRRMGGDLQVSSAPGQGSLFWFEVTLPTTERQAPTANRDRTAVPVVPPKRVLVADDNGVNLELLQQMLMKDGHHVTAVRNGMQALEALATSDFDVLMLDFNMGDVDGLTVYQTYAFGRLRPAPTFFVTADASAATAARLGDAGAAGVIYKPLSFDKLRRALLSVFPGEAAVAEQAPAPPPGAAPVVRLTAVPVELVDPGILDTLREIKDQPAFLYSMISEGLDDLRALQAELAPALAGQRLADAQLHAHAMRGVALSIGAIRLAALCERIMKLTHGQLRSHSEKLHADLLATTEASITALEQLRAPFAGAASSRSA
jgi:two-component system sensor histidine kinase RpfC